MHLRPTRSRRLLPLLLLLALVPAGVFGAWPWLAPRVVFMPAKLAPAEASPARLGMAALAEDVWIATPDGPRLHGWWFPARGPRDCGALVYFHGNRGNLLSRAPLGRALAGEGFDVLLLDYRGYGASEGRPSEAGLYLDARAAHDYVTTVRDVPGSEVTLLGHSLGTAVASELATHVKPRALVMMSPFTGLGTATRARFGWVPDRISAWGGLRFPTREHVARVSAPTLFVMGTRDRFVPLEDARNVFEAAGGWARWLEIDGAGHNDLASHERFWSGLRDFTRELGACHARDARAGRDADDPATWSANSTPQPTLR